MSEPGTMSSLPDLSEDYRLTPEAIRSFRENGHVLLRAVASSEEVAAYRGPIGKVVQEHSVGKARLEDRDTYGRAFLQITNLWQKCKTVRRFALAHRFAKIAADLMGVEGVRIYHDQALFKEADGGHTPWHQDQYYWPLDTDKTVTMWMPLVDVSLEMGAITFAGGSHRDGFLGHIKISDQPEEHFEALAAEKGFPIAVDAMAAGDATFHGGWTLHQAPGNNTDRMREVMTVIYYCEGARILEPDNENRTADLAAWHPGQQPGEVAASPLNPLVYHR